MIWLQLKIRSLVFDDWQVSPLQAFQVEMHRDRLLGGDEIRT